VPFVVDASIAGAWLLPDETSIVADAALIRLESDEAIVPDLFRHEVLNLLLSAERRNRISIEVLYDALHRLETFRLRTETIANSNLVIDLSRKHRLSGYDATYLAVAKHLQLPLATLDKHLIAAATAEDVATLENSAPRGYLPR
jgi:predicted nucleic acid-binding protein